MGQPLSERTLIPIGLAVIAIGGAAVWATTVTLQVQAQADQAKQLEQKQTSYTEELHQIHIEIEGIHGELKRIRR